MDNRREHAIVLGASMAGLLAARVLAEEFERVTQQACRNSAWTACCPTTCSSVVRPRLSIASGDRVTSDNGNALKPIDAPSLSQLQIFSP